jgi:hypothetical protein
MYKASKRTTRKTHRQKRENTIYNTPIYYPKHNYIKPRTDLSCPNFNRTVSRQRRAYVQENKPFLRTQYKGINTIGIKEYRSPLGTNCKGIVQFSKNRDRDKSK